MNVRNRWILLLAAPMAVALTLAAACGGTSSTDKTATAAAGGAGTTPTSTQTGGLPADAAPASQQKITMQSTEPQFYDPHRSNFEQDIAVERMLFRGLYNLTDDGSGGVKVVPGDAAGPPTISGNVYTVKLKSGLKWSDGKALTAADYVYGFQRECDPTVASPYQYVLGAGLGDLKGCDELFNNKDATKTQALKDALGVKALDASTLEFTLNRPVATFETIWSLWATFPSRQDVIQKFGDKWTDPGNIVVNGPFTMSELVPKDHVTLKPNPEWSGQKPAIQQLTIKFIDDLSAALKSFQTGELQMTAIQPTDVKVVKGDPSLSSELVIDPTARITAIEMQLKDPALAKFDVRLALSRAIDRKTLVDVVFDGVYTPATYWVVKGLKGFQGNSAFDSTIGFDKAAAQAAMASAGYPNGQGFPTLKLTLTDTPSNRNLADFLIKQWKDNLGITVTPDFVDGKTRSQRFNSGNFQLFPGGWQLDYPDIENPLVGLFDTGGGNNKYNCSDPAIDAAFKEATNATTEAARIAAYQKVETLVVTKLCGVAPIYQNAVPYLVNAKVGGVVPNGTIDASGPGTYCVECWYVKK
ncbi:MAG: peptide ABC transporter substrate-binding protein [Chloroflexota bacterium]|nr:peptide ABC transporter substrate-binding protein [Chloroflexota bacterium]